MRRGSAILAVGLSALLAQACSQIEPSPKAFTQVAHVSSKAEDKAQDPAKTLQTAEEECKEETKKKGIKSIAAIFSRLRPGAADQDYVECMRRRGFEVKS
ncbi:MAG TPA: hypothetical protein VNJ31_09640 [Methyloceanibacter sp.]|nr:hypothetical protein [Methyloceanibacter sp.]